MYRLASCFFPFKTGWYVKIIRKTEPPFLVCAYFPKLNNSTHKKVSGNWILIVDTQWGILNLYMCPTKIRGILKSSMYIVQCTWLVMTICSVSCMEYMLIRIRLFLPFLKDSNVFDQQLRRQTTGVFKFRHNHK